MTESITIREATKNDQGFLFDMLYKSIYHAPGTPKPDRSIINTPEISKYVADWGKPGDVAFVATHSMGKKVGAVWVRYFDTNNKGYGFICDDIPEMGIAVDECSRGQGIGTALIKEMLKKTANSVAAISLSVQRENPAMKLYQRLGFFVCGTSGDSVVMRFDQDGCSENS